MYVAHMAEAKKMKSKPNGSSLSSTPDNTATPMAAQPSDRALRRDRVRTAATKMGPMNSMATPLPIGSRSIAR
jgi:hypothetical protein